MCGCGRVCVCGLDRARGTVGQLPAQWGVASQHHGRSKVIVSLHTHTHTHKKKKKEKKKKTMADCAVHDSTDGLAHPEGRKDRDDERDSPVNRRLTDERSEKRAGHQVEELGKDGVRTLLASLQKHLRLRVRRVQLKKELTGLRPYASQVYRIPLRRNKRKNTIYHFLHLVAEQINQIGPTHFPP